MTDKLPSKTGFAIAAVADLLGKGVIMYGMTLIHPGLGLAYVGYIVVETAGKHLEKVERDLLVAKAEAQMEKLQGIFNKKDSDPTTTAEKETLH